MSSSLGASAKRDQPDPAVFLAAAELIDTGTYATPLCAIADNASTQAEIRYFMDTFLPSEAFGGAQGYKEPRVLALLLCHAMLLNP